MMGKVLRYREMLNPSKETKQIKPNRKKGQKGRWWFEDRMNLTKSPKTKREGKVIEGRHQELKLFGIVCMCNQPQAAAQK